MLLQFVRLCGAQRITALLLLFVSLLWNLIPSFALAQSWEMAADNPGDISWKQLDYPVIWVAAPIVEEVNLGGGVTGSYDTGMDVLSANRPSPGNELWIGFPNGVKKKLFPLSAHQSIVESPLGELHKGSVVEPNMSFDGKKVYFSFFHDQTFISGGAVRLPFKGADIYRMDLTALLNNPSINPASLPVVRITDRTIDPATGLQPFAERYQDAQNPTVANSVHATANSWGTVYMHAMELQTTTGLKLLYVSDKRRLWNSNRSQSAFNLNLNLFSADLHPDGSISNSKQEQYYTTTSAMSPAPLRNGYAFSYQATTGNARNWHAHTVDSEGRWGPGFGYGALGTGLVHLFTFCVKTTGSAPGDYLVMSEYYNANNEAHGPLFAQDTSKFGQNEFPDNDLNIRFWHQVGSYKITEGVPLDDEPSPFIAGVGFVGEFASPRCGKPDELLFGYSPTSANGRRADDFGNINHYRTYIGFSNLEPFHPHQAVTSGDPNGLRKVVRNVGDTHLAVWPTPVLTWAQRTGDASQQTAAPIIDSASTIAPGDPYSTVGTSALYNTDVRPFDCYIKNMEAYHPSKSQYINSVHENVIRKNDGLTVVQDQNDVCAGLEPSDVLGIAVQLTSNKPNTDTAAYETGANFPMELTKLLGVYDVRNQSDASFTANIPANVPFDFHLLDSTYGLRLADVRAWHSLKPRETRTDCGGCHNHFAGQGIPFAGTHASQNAPANMVTQTQYVDYDANCNPVIQTSPEAARGLPEWKEDIWPEFRNNCEGCHNPNLSGQSAALAALSFTNEKEAYDQLRDRKYAYPWNGALGSQLFWVLRKTRTDGRNNNLPHYFANHGADDHGFRLSDFHANTNAFNFCDGSNLGLAQWVYDTGRWIDNYMPRDRDQAPTVIPERVWPYGSKFDRYLPSIDGAIATQGCAPSAIRVGYWDDSAWAGSGKFLSLQMFFNGVQSGSTITGLSNGSQTFSLPSMSNTDILKFIVTDEAGNRSIYEKSLDDLLFECAVTNGNMGSSSTSSSSNGGGSSSSTSSGSSSSTSSGTGGGETGGDPGPPFVLQSPTYVLWNSFLEMLNFLELVNKDSTNKDVIVKLYDINGTLRSMATYTVPAAGQLDINVADLGGYSVNSYGIIELVFSGNLDGRMSQYKQRPDGSYQFAFNVPFEDKIEGISYVSFNTFNPSQVAGASQYLTLNWLSIVNLETTAQNYTVNRYSMTGNLISTESVTVPAFARLDIDGGHGEGPNQVGLNQIIPQNSGADYLALMVRYGTTSDPNSYSFAFPIPARAGGANQQWASISSAILATNWVEVVSTIGMSQNVTLRFYDNSGTLVSEQFGVVPAYGQLHFNATAVLPAGASGAVLISSDVPGGFDANSMFYFFTNSGDIDAMYGTKSGSSKEGPVVGSYNMFINLANWLRVFNAHENADTITVTVANPGGTPVTQTYTLQPRTGIDLILNEPQWQTSPNTYGLVTVDGKEVVSELVRLRLTAANELDIATGTTVR